MAGLVRDSLVDLERHRQQLEHNVAKLRASLQHWRAWEIEYEGMKEDILRLPPSHTQADLESVGNDAENLDFAGQSPLLTEKERRLLLRDDKGNPRQSQQVLGLLSRRVDYVQQNIKTILSLLETTEEKYLASQTLGRPEVQDEEGLPLTEIHEELDAEGNVISSSTSEPGKVAPQVVAALRKAGINELPESNVSEVQPSAANRKFSESVELKKPGTSASATVEAVQKTPNAINASVPLVTNVGKKPSESKKSVSFAKDTKEEARSTIRSKEARGASRPSEPKAGSVRSDKVSDQQMPNIVSDDEKKKEPFKAVIPENESPEDAALRRQMINYNMGEIGAIVAELDLDDVEAPYSEDDTEMDDYESSSAEGDEDGFGRTKRRVLSDEYVAEMQKLEQRLKNVGPEVAMQFSSTVESSKNEQQPGIGVERQNDSKKSKPDPKKGVRFANELDIQDPPPNAPSNQALVVPPTSTPVSNKPIHAPTVVERPPPMTTDPSTVPEPDDLDPALVQQEVSTAYYRMRNRMVQSQGGFVSRDDENEQAEVPLNEAEGGPKKMSRFKAARLGKLGN